MTNGSPLTATAYAAPTLHAPVEVIGGSGPFRIRVRTLPGGVGGWATPGKELTVSHTMLSTDDPATVADITEKLPTELAHPDPEPAPLTETITGEEYIAVLQARQAAWRTARTVEGRVPLYVPLLDHFVLPGDEQFVTLPDAAPRPRPLATEKPRPRQYRSAASLREERDKLLERMERVAGRSDTGDRAAANLSPHARSRAARTAGRRRFAQMDQDLAAYAALQRRVDAFGHRIARAQAREAASG